MTTSARKEWMLGIPGHNELVNIDQVLLLVRGGSLRPTDLVKKLGEPWRAANEVTELAPHFADVPGNALPKPVVVAAPAPTPAPAKPVDPPRQGEPIRSTTDRIPRTTSRPPDSSKTIPKIKAPEEKAPEPPKPAETREPIRTTTARVATVGAPPRGETRVIPPATPPKEDKKAETKPPTPEPDKKAETKPADADKTDKISARSLRKRDVPKPPPKMEPLIEPMAAKYYSPVDLLRCASFAFEPKKLLYSFPVVFLMIIWSIGMHRSGVEDGAFEKVLFCLFMAILVFGFAFIFTGLAFVSRRQLEGRDYYFTEVLHYTVKSAGTAFAYPLVALSPSLIALIILYLLKLVRNRSAGMASTLKVGFIIPMIFAFVAVLGALIYQVASMYVPAAGAAEGEGLKGSIRHAWDHVRRQWGRVVLHWLINTVAFGVIAGVCLGLSIMAIQLPEWVFEKGDETIQAAWNQFAGLQAVYTGLALGLGMLLPVSLFSTLGMLSYLSLRQPAGAQLSPSPMDDTSGIAIGAMRGGQSAMEATNPADTRPAPVESTGSSSDISDDSDEQPLVKD